MQRSLVGSEMCIRDSLYAGCQFYWRRGSDWSNCVLPAVSRAPEKHDRRNIWPEGGGVNAAKANNIRMEFEDNDILQLLSGEHNQHLAHIEKSLDVTLDSFGNSIKISGAANATKTARNAIENLYKTILETCRDADWDGIDKSMVCLLYTSPSPRDYAASRMPSSA